MNNAYQCHTVKHLAVIRASGDDTVSFLQSQITCDLVALQNNDSSWGGHCDPKGKLLAAFRMIRQSSGVLLILPKEIAQQDLAQIQKYAVFNKVAFEDITDTLFCYAITGDSNAFIEQHFSPFEGDSAEFNGTTLLRQPHGLLVFSATELALETSKGFWVNEIQAGLPLFGEQHMGQYIPQMFNLQALSGISFEKGCYLGQETVARIHYRGGLKRRLFCLSGQAKADVAAGAGLTVDGRRSGEIIAAAQKGEQLDVLAIMSIDADENASYQVADIDSDLKVQPLSYTLD
ncbi:YgfZ/GcvT domain-containing protein [Paraferrimonas haliotis]|uniref:CAF17-like 4Fe-4S cluster assembly/insertion protein YgfZ n=1 Tax=Paraferrimonas haliotis TaxID=2013866 RepID=UPI000BA99299|nr:folate-binding protein YgfZ [Paraferrimonas haliotis]